MDSVNHARFPKEDHLPDWARRDNKVTTRDRVDDVDKIHVDIFYMKKSLHIFWWANLFESDL